MGDGAMTKPLGFCLIVTAHMLHNGCSHQTDVIGILNKNIILEFQFQNFTDISTSSVYTEHTRKIADCTKDKNCSGSNTCVFNHVHAAVFYCIMNLTDNHSKIYWATLFPKSGEMKHSNHIHLIIREDNTTSRGAPVPQNNTSNGENEGSNAFLVDISFVAAISFLAFLVALLPWFIWCLVKNKEHHQQQIPNPILQETVVASINLPAPSPIYSILDFPKRPHAALEIQPTETEYAAVSHLPKKRRL
ncbi:uncharacterized protein LOC117519530 [Thalassophryne amazonica]|uniref:uncharacterized protein LOC117519530 n=1 Tax=Thalassophryne amazonica TaxID=390379 RepID=UPI00147143C0|nr:uncharacterized protein LOC117519530 [Thalassophryne amazonica]